MTTQAPILSGTGPAAHTTPEPSVNPSSSPLLQAREKSGRNGKPKKKPTVTPRTFTRFFTPRSSLGRGGKVGASRQALRDITASAQNRKQSSRRRTPTKDSIQIFDDQEESFPDDGRKKKRKIFHTPATTPDLSSPLKRISRALEPLDVKDDSEDEEVENDEDTTTSRSANHEPRSIRYGTRQGPIGRTLGRELGRAKVVKMPYEDCTVDEWQSQTTKFYTKPDDSYMCLNIAEPTSQSIPFCTASCNTNSLVAIGDEDGGVRLLETAKDLKPTFGSAYLKFRPHANAILDLAFSHDDMLLATASGDQTAQIIDMPSQRPTYSMTGHVSSVKQVRFQPGSSSNVIATSSRDGSVQVWDLRCKGSEGPVREFRVSLEPSDGDVNPRSSEKMTWLRPVDSIYEAHTGGDVPSSGFSSVAKLAGDAPSKTESPGRRGDVSTTALTFLPPGQEHLLATASEANANIKLWDLRTTHSHRRSRATPLSTTQQPESHSRHRHFGMNSLALSGDGGRLYALCRDNTVYAYSTSHLVLGHVPELSWTSSKSRRSGGRNIKGLGPIYGFRHQKFHATTFYVKLAVRPAADDMSEILAIGSSDGCAVVFPTDERYMGRHRHSESSNLPITAVSSTRPRLGRSPGSFILSNRMNDNIPIYQHGSALVRGHTKEVTSLTWSADGELVTVGDDFTARCWREGPEARDLRTGGETEGRRWNSGWAEVEGNWDDDDE